MSIHFQKEKRIFTIHTKHTTYQFMADPYGFLIHLYYGEKTEGTMDYLLTYMDRGFSGNPYDAGEDRTYSLDALPQEFPFMGSGDFRSTALIVRNEDQTYGCDLRYKSHQIYDGKYSLQGLPAVYGEENQAQTLQIDLEDAVSGLTVTLYYGVLPQYDIITRSTVITNGGNERIYVEKADSGVLDFVYGDYDLMTFYGRHARERNVSRTPVDHGRLCIGSWRGASSHQYNPAMILAQKGTDEDHGLCYGMALVYSGSFSGEVMKDQYNQTRVLMGLPFEQMAYPLDPGQKLIVPETVMSSSSRGLAALSRNFHKCFRRHLCRGKYQMSPRPVLVNSWEAAYFDFTGETILKLARDAAGLGIDMVVLDDGWFGKRNDDNTSLGDWQVNEEKLGCSMGELADQVNALGVKFGLWIEPEMVSEDSDLYRAHPDWALKVPGRRPVRGRNQLVLDFSRAEVRDHVFRQICQVLDHAHIEYIKWDMNRSICDIYSEASKDQGRVLYDYMLGVYDFLEKLTSRYPDILLEGCCGGGGRFDPGMLYYTPQIWCSDNTDAIDRTRIQYGTSFFYPVSCVGAHVSAVPNHQTGRSVSMETRAIAAMAGTFGYELDLGQLSDEEREEVRCHVQNYRKYYRLIADGDYYRLSDPFHDPLAAWAFVAEDGSEALVSAIMLEIHGNMTVNYLKLKGLDPSALYKDTHSGRIYSGGALMYAGFPLPVKTGEYRAFQIHLEMQQEVE